MYKNLFFPLLIILFVFSCEEPINKNDSNEEALKAFSKIDDKKYNNCLDISNAEFSNAKIILPLIFSN